MTTPLSKYIRIAFWTLDIVDNQRSSICSYEHIDIYERLRQNEQSRRLAWQVLQEIRQVLEILGDQRIPYEGEMKRFRAEGDFVHLFTPGDFTARSTTPERRVASRLLR